MKAARQRWRSVLARLFSLCCAPDDKGVDAPVVGAQDLEAESGDAHRFVELRQSPELGAACMEFNAFTDIEFNPKRSLNCQAAAVALFVAMERRTEIADMLSSQTGFRQKVGVVRASGTSAGGLDWLI